MNKDIKKIIKSLDERLILIQTIKEPVNPDLDKAIKLSVAYEQLQKENKLLKKRINKTLEIAYQYAQIDGSHHRIWVIDQMLRELLGDKYKKWVKEYEKHDYNWDIGIAP